MNERIGLEIQVASNQDFFTSQRGRTAHAMPSTPVSNSEDPIEAPEVTTPEVARLARYLETRGLEVSYRINPDGGGPQLIISDPVSGRTVVEVPRGSTLERTIVGIIQRAG